MSDTIQFTDQTVKAYLDGAIRHWRRKRDKGGCEFAMYYIDAFQSVRTSLFGETLPEEPEE